VKPTHQRFDRTVREGMSDAVDHVQYTVMATASEDDETIAIV
jgi:hypothetical protein